MANYRYFLFSSSQLEFRRKIEARIGKKFKPGSVIVNGKKLPFTELSKEKKSKYSDVKIIAYGDIDIMKYNMPESE